MLPARTPIAIRSHVISSQTDGFTLIELLVVIAIIGVLATVVLASISPKTRLDTARDSQRRADLAQIRDALEHYATAHQGVYPTPASTTAFYCNGCGGNGTTVLDGGANWIPNLQTDGYIKRLPTDPQNGLAQSCASTSNNVSGYLYRSNGTDYKLIANCTPLTGLNKSTDGSFCVSSNYQNPSTTGVTLQRMVDPQRPTFAYAVWSASTATGANNPACW